MNRQQAEHLLDAYFAIKVEAYDDSSGEFVRCADSLRDVILDVMTTDRASRYAEQNWQKKNAALPTVAHPINDDDVTWTSTWASTEVDA